MEQKDYIEEVLQVRNDLTREVLHQYCTGLTEFQTSHRFLVMKPLQITRFIDAELNGDHPLRGATLGELVDFDVTELCLVHKTPAPFLQEMAEFFINVTSNESGVVNGEDFMDPMHSIPLGAEEMPIPEDWKPAGSRLSDTPPAPGTAASVRAAMPDLPSVEEERILRAALDELQQADDYKKIASSTIETFWAREFGAAPFVESLTFHQLLSMSLTDLMDKHYYSIRISLGIVEAVKRALRSIGVEFSAAVMPPKVTLPGASSPSAATGVSRAPIAGQEVDSTDTAVPPSKPSAPAFVAPSTHQTQLEAVEWPIDFPHSLRGIYSSVYSVSQSCRGKGAPFFESLFSFSQDFSPAEVVLLLVEADPKTQGFFEERGCYPRSFEEALAGFKTSVSKKHQELLTSLNSLLAAPAVKFSQVVQMFIGDPVQDLYGVQQAYLFLLLHAVGAKSCYFHDYKFEGYWTKAPRLFQLAVDTVMASVSCTEAEMRSLLEEVLPSAERKDCEAFFRLFLDFDEGAGLWKLPVVN